MPPAQRFSINSGKDLGRAVSQVRADRELSQAELAELAGIDPTYLSRLENGLSVLLLDRAIRALRRMGATIEVTLPGEDVDGT